MPAVRSMELLPRGRFQQWWATGVGHPRCLVGSHCDRQHTILALRAGLQQLPCVTLTGTPEKGLGLRRSKLRKPVATWNLTDCLIS